MEPKTISRFDSAVFWVAVSAVVGLFGFGLIGFGASAADRHHQPVSHDFWFRLGLSGIAISVGLLVFSVVLYQRHKRTPALPEIEPRPASEPAAFVTHGEGAVTRVIDSELHGYANVSHASDGGEAIIERVQSHRESTPRKPKRWGSKK